MNDTNIDKGLRDYYESITPADSVRATNLVVASIRARRERSATRDNSARPWALIGIAVALIVALVTGVGFEVWRTGQNLGRPGGAVGTPSPTTQPSPTLRAATKSTPANKFSPTGSMSGRYETATLLLDGRVLVTGDNIRTTIGGFTVPIYTPSAQLYDPATGTFSQTGSMFQTRGGESVTRLQDGRVLFAGGTSIADNAGQLAVTQLATAELYDPATGQFSPTGSMSHARSEQTATLLADGDVLIAGGQGNASGMDSTAELYDPNTGTFRPTGALTEARWQATATPLIDGRVLIVGGYGNNPAQQASAELYDPNTGEFSPTGSMTTDRSGYTATLLPDGHVLIAGGLSGSTSLATAELYDPATGKFSLTGSMTTGRDGHTATLLSDGRVLIAGGSFSSGGAYVGPSLAMTDYGAAKFSRTAMADYRQDAALSGGLPLIEAGYADPRSIPYIDPGILGATIPSAQLTSAELYDPKTGKFSPTGSMGTARNSVRNSPTATLLLDGRVLVAGGDSPEGRSAELYQP
jgi:hypothetical protein